MADARDERHRYGQHYTPVEVARLLAAFVVRSDADLVFDPSCGDGRLLAEALRRKSEITPERRGPLSAREVYGIDRSAPAVELAGATRAQVARADFFDITPGAAPSESVILPASFDAIIGNPPYIRQELMDTPDKRRIEKRLALDRIGSRDLIWPRWSGRSDIYVYFFAHAACFLKERARLVFLTASSWLDVGYGAALRQFLLNNFCVRAVIESSAESFFADASINTCITVLERQSEAQARKANRVRFVRLDQPLSRIVEGGALSDDTPAAPSRSGTCSQNSAAVALATSIERASESVTTDAYRIRIVEQEELAASGCTGGPRWPPLVEGEQYTLKINDHREPPVQDFALAGSGWGKYLRASDVFFNVIERGNSRLQSLSNMASVRFGVKTGANEFFYVKDAGQRAKGKGPALLALANVASVRRGITTGANEFFYLSRAALRTENEAATTRGGRSRAQGSTNVLTVVLDAAGALREIETELLAPVVFSLKEIPGILIERVEAQRMLFNCSLSPIDLAGTRALEYIESGERAGYDRRPTCSNREPWYSVARGMKAAPLIFPSKVGERWLVALNRAGVFEDKKLYGIFPKSGVSELALAALLNSTWARYYAEITCRQMTGAQAIADIDVAVAEQIMIPNPRELSRQVRKKLETALVTLARRPVYSIFEEVKREDRRRLDALTLEAIGFVDRIEREGVLDELYAAATELVRARLSKSRAR